MNVAKDDVLSFPAVTHRTYPATVEARMESTIKPFVTKSLEVTNKLLEVFERQLGLPEGEFAARHNILLEAYSALVYAHNCFRTAKVSIKSC